MDLFRRHASPIDRDALRDQMAREDPAFARVRDIHHDAIAALSAKRGADGLSIRREREFWERSGGSPRE